MSKKIAFFITAICAVFMIVIIIGAASSGKQREAERQRQEEERLSELRTNNVAEKLESYFTEESAIYLAEIFEKVGITYIHSIKKGPGSGIGDLQAFTCKIYDLDNVTLTFTFEKNRLAHMELNGSSFFGDKKLHAVLYKNGRCLNKFDYENNQIIEIN